MRASRTTPSARLIGFTSGWVAFLGAVTVGADHGPGHAPVHVELRLLADTVSGGRPVLTAQGYVVAAAMLLLFCTINVLGVRWLAETNMLAVCWKIFVPVLTVVALLATSAHRRELHSRGRLHALRVEGRVPRAGVRRRDLRLPRLRAGGPARRREPQPEAEHPARDHRRRCSSPSACTSRSRWRSSRRSTRRVSPTAGARSRSPARPSCSARSPALATALGLGWLAVMLYTDAIVSPGGTGLLYTGASARLSFALARNGHIPGAFARLTRRGTPLVRDRVLVPLRPRALPPVPRLAAARRLHLRRGRPRLRDGAALARSAPTAGPGAAAPLPAARGMARGTGRIRRRERDPALHGLGRGLEADRGDPDRLRAADGLVLTDDARKRIAVARLAQCRLALAVPARHGSDLVPRLVRHGNAELDPAARPRRASQRAHVRLGRPRRRSPQPRRLRLCDPESASRRAARSNTSATPRQRQNPRTSLFAR